MIALAVHLDLAALFDWCPVATHPPTITSAVLLDLAVIIRSEFCSSPVMITSADRLGVAVLIQVIVTWMLHLRPCTWCDFGIVT